jgi:hypothetical protein
VDGAVYVKIFRKQADQDKTHANGFFLQDQFFAVEDISLAAKGSKEITFDWKVPNYAVSGDYRVAAFFTSAKKFNLLGLTFTDDVVGNIFDFTVKGENDKNVEFDKNNVDVNDNNYHFAAFPSRSSKDEDISVKANLVNSTDTTQIVPVTWTLYYWDGQQEQNIIDVKKETISLNPGETKNLEYKIQDKNHPVYFLVAEADYKDDKSILDIRTAREGIDQTRINFPSVTKYPLKAGESNTLFVCAHNSGMSDVVDNNKLTVSILDQNKKEIHAYTYTGKISGAMMGLKDDFVPNENYDNFYIKSELYTDGKLVDSAEMKYDCQKINPEKCQGRTINQKKSPLSLSVAIGLIFFLVGIAVIILYRKNHNSGIKTLILLFLLLGMFFWGGVNGVEAKSVTWNETVLDSFCHHYNAYPENPWPKGLENPNFTINYYATINNAITNSEISDGSSIPVGTKIKVAPKIFEDTDISWNGTGYGFDTPFGHWVNAADFPSAGHCKDWDFVQEVKAKDGGGWLNVFIPFSVDPPSVSISTSGTTAGLSDCRSDGATLSCTVSSAGNIKLAANFSKTYGKLYYDYNGYSLDPGCHDKDDRAMRKAVTLNKGAGAFCTKVESGDYIQNVPAQTISFNLTASSPNSPPSCPIITGPTIGNVNTPYDFIFTSTDPDNDQLRYNIDWDNSGSGDQYLPSSGYVNSGTSQTGNHAWTSIGGKTFQAIASDNKGNNSGWCGYTINITNVPINGQCGPPDGQNLSSAPATVNCVAGIPSVISGTGPWSWTCSGSNGGVDAKCTANLSAAPINGQCGPPDGQNLSSAPATVSCVSPTAPSLISGTGPWTWTCPGSNGGTDAGCIAYKGCIPDSNCASHPITWGSCSGNCSMQTGTCNDGCGGTGTTTQACLPCCTCVLSISGDYCQGTLYPDSCGANVCAGTKNCSIKPFWKEVAP